MSARVFDPEVLSRFPRAPSADAWAAMSDDERARVVAALPAMMTEAELLPPEGDPHTDAKNDIRSTLGEYFRRRKRSVYLATDLTVYYPDSPRFAPDVLAVVDVDVHPRMKWVVSAEGRGLDVVFEVHVAGDRRKDLERNVELYARLGIPEYFAFDRSRRHLHAFRLAKPDARTYVPVVPQGGYYTCEVLGLELMVVGDRVRFFVGGAMLPDMSEVVARLEAMASDATRRAEDEARRAEDEARRAGDEARRAEDQARRAEDQARRAEDEARRAEDEARRAEDLARQVAELQAELEKARSRS